jgi:hypothetical protein
MEFQLKRWRFKESRIESLFFGFKKGANKLTPYKITKSRGLWGRREKITLAVFTPFPLGYIFSPSALFHFKPKK